MAGETGILVLMSMVFFVLSLAALLIEDEKKYLFVGLASWFLPVSLNIAHNFSIAGSMASGIQKMLSISYVVSLILDFGITLWIIWIFITLAMTKKHKEAQSGFLSRKLP